MNPLPQDSKLKNRIRIILSQNLDYDQASILADEIVEMLKEEIAIVLLHMHDSEEL